MVNGATSISHLVYADGMHLFSKANPKALHNIQQILEQFSAFTELEINNQKCSVVFTKICEDNLALQDILGFFVGKLPIIHWQEKVVI